MSTVELAERRLAALQLANQARRAPDRHQDALTGTLRRDFADMNEWERLAVEAGVQLPYFDTPLTTGIMERWLRKLGISREAYYGWDGSGRMSDFPRRNPTWTARAWVGLILEHRDLMLDLYAQEATP